MKKRIDIHGNAATAGVRSESSLLVAAMAVGQRAAPTPP